MCHGALWNGGYIGLGSLQGGASALQRLETSSPESLKTAFAREAVLRISAKEQSDVSASIWDTLPHRPDQHSSPLNP